VKKESDKKLSSPRRSRRSLLILAAVAVVLVLVFWGKGKNMMCPFLKTASRPHLNDNSDVWSLTVNSGDFQNVKIQNRDLADANFQILGITLNDYMFSPMFQILGKTSLVERGEATNGGRQQACYVSAPPGPKVYLIFERGGINSVFYFFSEGQAWRGQESCASSPLVGPAIATASGLRLGESPSEVTAILGTPAVRRDQELIYYVFAQRKTPARMLKMMHEAHPNLNVNSFESLKIQAQIRATFVDSKLTSLAVARAAAY
jgi:hypothetical protein